MFSFWNGKKILLTGHTGFKGSWLSLILNELGAQVCGYSLPVLDDSFYKLANISVEFHNEGDISDKDRLVNVAKKFKPDIIIHLASHSSLDGCDSIPDYIFKTNSMGVVNVLECARCVSTAKSVVIVTSDKCYKNENKDIAYTEDDELWAQDPYSASKVIQEIVTNSYSKFFFENKNDGPNVATARACNVIGPGDYNYTRLLPYVLKCFSEGDTAKLRSRDAIRSWQCVWDVLWGYLLLAKKLYEVNDHNINGAYNFGPTEQGYRTVDEIVKGLASQFEPKGKYEYADIKRSVENEAKILKLDSSKAKSILSWEPIMDVEHTLQVMVNFVQGEKRGEKLSDISRKVLREYMARRNLDA